ncbi:MAG: hypothetical protein IH987_17795 [Planctomycetes bacterium]|nr:hypothetical protein [Planctomycetota bacterium]
MTLRLSAAPGELSTAERTVVQVEIVAEDGITVSPDSYENALRESEHRFDFRFVGGRKEEARPIEGGALRWRYIFELEFVLPESYELPAASLSFADSRTTTGSESQTLQTETLPIVVRESADQVLPPQEMMSVETLAPVELPIDWLAWWWVAPIFLVFLFAIVVLLRRRRRVRATVAIVIPAHEWARRELAALASEGLIERGEIQPFHYRISFIVRGYIERRFDVAASEMTTEEFLATTAGDGRFGAEVSSELQQFLQACDMVKYARFEPGPDEPNRLMQSAIDFVDRTYERPGAADHMARIEGHAA